MLGVTLPLKKIMDNSQILLENMCYKLFHVI